MEASWCIAARRLRPVVAGLLFIVIIAMPIGAIPAYADDGESALSFGLGYGRLVVDESAAAHGGVFGVNYERGFSDALSWQVSAGVGGYLGDQARFSTQASAGFVYRLDVLKYVPYVSLGAGGILSSDTSGEVDIAPLVELGVGLDWLQDRHVSYGLFGRIETLLQETSFLTAGVRMTWRWGFF